MVLDGFRHVCVKVVLIVLVQLYWKSVFKCWSNHDLCFKMLSEQEANKSDFPTRWKQLVVSMSKSARAQIHIFKHTCWTYKVCQCFHTQRSNTQCFSKQTTIQFAFRIRRRFNSHHSSNICTTWCYIGLCVWVCVFVGPLCSWGVACSVACVCIFVCTPQ